ncbi:hypothetical protein Rs2_40842 [Raphanus sativus]|uniref:Nucleolin 1 n=1 Tax=Raphanus sativus TaxID=3726 RepID=A0A6J0N126_RAPSA|nr:nucleolin 1 [Raphanus sativus]KAJ4875824.1 hypothetical protein Rs2_40842 [Raphanus sativus]
MDAYDILRSERLEFESEAAEKAFADRISGKPRALISVTGYNPNLPEDDIKKELIELFSSCGDVTRVIVPKDPDHSPNLDRRALVILFGDGAEEKALQLNGTDVGGWNALVKVESDEEDEEAARYRSSLINELMNDPKFWYGVSVRGYDTSLPVDQVERALKEHFSDCGEITHVFVDTLDKLTNVYFSLQEGEARALARDGIRMGEFELDISGVPSVLSNRPNPFGNGEIEIGLGYTVPAHMIEFANKDDDEIENKVIAFKKQRRLI